MGKDKLRKFSEIDTFPNVYQLHLGKVMKGKWATDHFKNNQPIVLELACGKGEYAVNLAKLFPEKNFIGVDLKGNRIWRGARTGVDEGITNLAFLRIQIEDILEYFKYGASFVQLASCFYNSQTNKLNISKINNLITPTEKKNETKTY